MYIYAHTYTEMHVHTYVCAHAVRVCMHTYRYMHISTCVLTCAHICTHMYAHMCVNIYRSTPVCAHAYT